MAAKITSFYKDIENKANDGQPIEVLAVCLLKGAFMFYSDLVRKLPFKIVCDFVKISSYAGEKSTGEIKVEGGFNPEKLKGKHVLIIEDMADTGLTLSKFRAMVEKSEPATLKIAVLVNRPDKPKSFTIDWIGLECSDFIIGYGLDYD
jgi:hypoxanthine phosphoribosyltransferase